MGYSRLNGLFFWTLPHKIVDNLSYKDILINIFIEQELNIKIVNLKDKRFGRLLVKNKLKESRDGSILWDCKCDCGNFCRVTTRHLNRKNNTVKSCGCLKFIKGKHHKDFTGYEEISGNWWNAHVLHSANSKKRAKILLSITIKQAWNLFLRQKRKCYYTGWELVINNSFKINTASIDRIDSSKGYSLKNIAWVHKDINMMKRNYSSDYFKCLCNAVSSNLK